MFSPAVAVVAVVHSDMHSDKHSAHKAQSFEVFPKEYMIVCELWPHADKPKLVTNILCRRRSGGCHLSVVSVLTRR